MTFSEWIDGERGRASRIATSFSPPISISAVLQWKSNGVPVDRMLVVRDLTNGEVTVEEMVESVHQQTQEAA